MLKRRKATVVSSSASVITPVATVPTRASAAASAAHSAAQRPQESTFETNVKFRQELQSNGGTAVNSAVGGGGGGGGSTLTYTPSSATHYTSSSSSSSAASSGTAQPLPYLRTAAGAKWEDKKLAEFDPEHNFCIFVGDLGNECTDEMLTTAFGKYPSFVKARVIKDALTQKNKGYGFVAYRDAKDYVAAVREMNGKYVGNRPVKLRKATFEKRVDQAALARLAKRNKQK
jgi:hypothetical protein